MYLKDYDDFINEGLFSSMKIEPGKNFLVTRKFTAENKETGELYVVNKGELIDNIKRVEKGFVIFDKTLPNDTVNTYAVKKKTLEKSVEEEVEFPRKVIIKNLAEMISILKNIKYETSYKERKDITNKIYKALNKKSNEEIKTLLDSLNEFNIIFSRF